MILPLQWKSYFDSVILSRGKSYFRSGAVRSLVQTGTHVSAEVMGSTRYIVEIEDADDRIEMSCTCPYARGVGRCKHMAAVCFALEKEGKPGKEEKHGHATGAGTTAPSVASPRPAVSLDTVPVDQLREFVRFLIAHDERIQTEFDAWVSDEFSETDLKHTVDRLSRIVDAIFEDYFRFHGYRPTDSDEDDDPCIPLRDSVQKMIDQLVHHRHYEFVFRILCAVSEHATETSSSRRYSYDDSGKLANYAVQEILLRSLARFLNQPISAKLRNQIYSWIRFLLIHRVRAGYWNQDLDSLIWTLFFVEIPTSKEEKKVLQLIDELLTYGVTEQLLTKKFQLMESLGVELAEIEAAEDCYLSEWWVCNRRICRACTAGDYAKAAAVLDAYVMLVSPDAVAIGVMRLLGDLYVRANDIPSAVSVRRLILSTGNMNLADFRAYRSLFSATEWPDVRDAAISRVPKYRLNMVLLDEKLYDQLVSRLIKSPMIEEIQEYEPYIGGQYPREFATVRVSLAKKMMDSAVTRTHYRQAVLTLSGALAYLEGQALVTEVVSDWLERYPRHRALWEEVKKIAGLHCIWSSIVGN